MTESEIEDDLFEKGRENLKIKDVKIQIDRLNIPKKRRRSDGDQDNVKKFKFGDEELVVNWSIDTPKKSSYECQICRKGFKDATALTYHEIHHPEVTSATVLPTSLHPLTSTADRAMTCLTINSKDKPVPGRRRVRVKSFPDERVPLLVDTDKNCSLPLKREPWSPSEHQYTWTQESMTNKYTRQFPAKTTRKRLRSCETSKSAKSLNNTDNDPALLSPNKSPPNILKIVKIADKKWKVNCDMDVEKFSFNNFHTRKVISDVHSALPEKHEQLVDKEVLRYVRSKKSTRGGPFSDKNVIREQLEDKLKVIAAEPKYFDEDDFDVVMEGQNGIDSGHEGQNGIDSGQNDQALLNGDISEVSDDSDSKFCEHTHNLVSSTNLIKPESRSSQSNSGTSLLVEEKANLTNGTTLDSQLKGETSHLVEEKPNLTKGRGRPPKRKSKGSEDIKRCDLTTRNKVAESSTKKRSGIKRRLSDPVDSSVKVSRLKAENGSNERKTRHSLNLPNKRDKIDSSRDTSVSSDAGSDRRFSERRFKGEKPYICNHCPLTFSSLDNKVVHERTHKEKPFECPFCEMRFSFELSKIRHVKIHK